MKDIIEGIKVDYSRDNLFDVGFITNEFSNHRKNF